MIPGWQLFRTDSEQLPLMKNINHIFPMKETGCSYCLNQNAGIGRAKAPFLIPLYFYIYFLFYFYSISIQGLTVLSFHKAAGKSPGLRYDPLKSQRLTFSAVRRILICSRKAHICNKEVFYA